MIYLLLVIRTSELTWFICYWLPEHPRSNDLFVIAYQNIRGHMIYLLLVTRTAEVIWFICYCSSIFSFLCSYFVLFFIMRHLAIVFLFDFHFTEGPSWPWSYDSWIYNYLCNQCLLPLMLWVWISIRAMWTTLCDKSLSVTCDRSVVFSGYSGFLHQ